jgi:hypothetical protein
MADDDRSNNVDGKYLAQGLTPSTPDKSPIEALGSWLFDPVEDKKPDQSISDFEALGRYLIDPPSKKNDPI